MNASDVVLRVSGSDLIFSISIVDSNGDAVTSSQTVDISVFQYSNSRYWNDGTSDFDQVAEPALDSAAQIGSTGIYSYTLSGGYTPGNTDYRIRIDADDTVEKDFVVDNDIGGDLVGLKLDHLAAVADSDDPVNDSILAKMSASDGDWSGFDKTTDSLEAIRDRGDAAWSSAAMNPEVLQETTIATLASQVSFTLTAGSADDNAYNDCMVVIEDSVTGVQKAVGTIDDYTGGTKTVTLLEDPGIFTMAVGDNVAIMAKKSRVKADLTHIAGLTTIDGVDISDFFEKAQSILYGKVIRSGGNFKYRDQGDANDLVDYDVAAGGRTIN
jgi:hypothetical protein